MPSVLIEVKQQYQQEMEIKIIDAVNRALYDAFQLKPSDVNTRLVVHAAHRFQCAAHYSQPQHFTHVSIDCFVGRSVEEKRRLYKQIVTHLDSLGIPADHVFIVLKENLAENFGVRGGIPASDFFSGLVLSGDV